MFEIECTINTSVPMQPTKVYLETNFPLSFIQEKKKFINSQFEWKVPSLYFESSAAAKPSLCGSCLSIRVIVLTVVSIIELLRWAAAADKSPFALVIGASWVRVRFSDSATGRPLKMCYLRYKWNSEVCDHFWKMLKVQLDPTWWGGGFLPTGLRSFVLSYVTCPSSLPLCCRDSWPFRPSFKLQPSLR